MKFRHYINENYKNLDIENIDEIISLLKKDCKPILKIYKKTDFPIFRGLKKNKDFFIKKKVRQNRRPRIISDDLHNFLDKLFKEIWGWKVRSEGLFCGTYMLAKSWGKIYTIYPIGKFEYLWTKNPRDGFWEWLLELESYTKKDIMDIEDYETENLKKDIKRLYNDKGLKNILEYTTNEYEIILKCKEYYALSSTEGKFHYIKERI